MRQRNPQLTTFVPRGAYTYLAKESNQYFRAGDRKQSDQSDPKMRDHIIRSGEADLVTMARGLLADPDLPNKALAGKSHTFITVVACNQGCLDNIFRSSGP